MGVPGEDGPGILPGLEFLKAVNRGERPDIGHRVAVIGGGNTAMDCARTALRLGAEPIVVYRRTRDQMPAIPQEVEEAMAEGIEFVFLAAPELVPPRERRLVGMHLTRMELGSRTRAGVVARCPLRRWRLHHRGGHGAHRHRRGHGAGRAAGVAAQQWGALRVDALGGTGSGAYFAGGDLAGAERTVADALGSGKRAAIGIDRYLREHAGRPRRTGGRSALGSGQVSMSRWRGDDPVRRTNPTRETVDIEALQLAHFRHEPRHRTGRNGGPRSFGE
jgi:NADPH-dependent glutamate synthase beta subunit-like oxidoreductase